MTPYPVYSANDISIIVAGRPPGTQAGISEMARDRATNNPSFRFGLLDSRFFCGQSGPFRWSEGTESTVAALPGAVGLFRGIVCVGDGSAGICGQKSETRSSHFARAKKCRGSIAESRAFLTIRSLQGDRACSGRHCLSRGDLHDDQTLPCFLSFCGCFRRPRCSRPMASMGRTES